MLSLHHLLAATLLVSLWNSPVVAQSSSAADGSDSGAGTVAPGKTGKEKKQPTGTPPQTKNALPKDFSNHEPAIVKVHQSKPFVIVENMPEAVKGDVVCFISRSDRKIACGKVSSVLEGRILVKVTKALLPKLEVGMEAILKKSREAQRRADEGKKKKAPVSKEKQKFKDGNFDWSFEVGAGARYYPLPPLQSDQSKGLGYFFAEPQLSFETKEKDHLFKLHPFYRYDAVDENRTLGDIRELEYIGIKDIFEWRVGVRKVFWGVTESVHLVDIINQTDYAADIDGEAKIGQPMINLAITQERFTFDFYLMSFFRERTFPGRNGRVRPPFRILDRRSTFESKDGKDHIDAAARVGIQLDGIDIGLSYFNGNGREPIFNQAIDEANNLVLIPRYILIDQMSLDLQWALSEFVLKLEALQNRNEVENFTAFVAGLDYTRYGIFGSTFDVTFIAEYMKDSRENPAFLPLFQDDLFLGARLAFNDAGLSSLLLGQYYDLEFGSLISSLELVKRFEAPYKVSINVRGFGNTKEDDPLHLLRRDSYANMELSYIF